MHRVASLPGDRKAVGLWQGQWAKQGGIGEREDGAIGADTERQRDYRDERESLRRFELPHRKSHVVSQLLEPLCQSHFSISLSAKVYAGPLEPSGITNTREHHLARDPRIHPLVHELACPHLDVKRDLVIHLSVDVDTP